MKPCDVCYGTPGRYPIINRFGSQLYDITCPECGGNGKQFEDPELPSAEDVKGARSEPATST